MTSRDRARHDAAARVHVLLAEALRCLEDGLTDAVRRKVAYADALVCDLDEPPGPQEAARQPVGRKVATVALQRSHQYDTFNAKVWMRRALTSEEELTRILAVLPEPIWNEHRVLVWSMLDIDRVKRVLEARSQ